MECAKNTTAAVVVTWNRKELLRQNLQCLLGQEGATCDILLVDNASTDGTKAMIDEEFDDPRIHYHNTGENLGGAGGFQVGIDWAAREGYGNIWIMDDDCLPSPTALAKLLEADDLLRGNWGWLCSAIYWTDGEICTFNRPKKDVFRHVKPEDYELGLVPAKMTSFVSVMFKGDVVRELGLPISEYFIWTDDYEFTGRISKKYPCYAVPASTVVHAMKSNARPSLATINEGGMKRFYYLSRNDVHCYRQHGLMGHAYLAVKAAYTAADVLIHAPGKRKERLAQLVQGTRDGLNFKPNVPMVGETGEGGETPEKAKVAILSTQTTRVLPYLKLYEEILGEYGFDLIYWDRHGYKDADDSAKNVYRYSYSHSSDSDKLHGIRGYIGFAKFAKDIINRNNYSGLVILQVQTGVTIKGLLLSNYKGKYILDIRDYSYEWLKPFKDIEKDLIESSYRTVISSDGFRIFLPEYNYVNVHNIPLRLPDPLPQKSPEGPIVITYPGCIHYYEQNVKLIDLFGNDERFQLRFIGEGSETLQDYVSSNDIRNVVLRGAFMPEEEESIYETSDVISNAYGNNIPLLDYALANKLYLAIAYRKPLLVSKGTYSAKLATDIGIGYIVDFDDPNCKDGLIEFVSSIDYESLDAACAKAMTKFVKDNEAFKSIVKAFADKVTGSREA